MWTCMLSMSYKHCHTQNPNVKFLSFYSFLKAEYWGFRDPSGWMVLDNKLSKQLCPWNVECCPNQKCITSLLVSKKNQHLLQTATKAYCLEINIFLIVWKLCTLKSFFSSTYKGQMKENGICLCFHKENEITLKTE